MALEELAINGRAINGQNGGEIAAALLFWYDRHHRDLPWRTPPAAVRAGGRSEPYHVWLSEIMLQQTTVEAVKPYFRKFTALWPTVGALADADPDDIMKAWAGLGYYSRARNLVKCAREIVSKHGGIFPRDEAELKALPGIGDYTAAAVAAIAFDRPATVVDGNVERVVSRLAALERPAREAKPEIRRFVRQITPLDRPGDFAQGMMDLGATICTPRNPTCFLCPLSGNCIALERGEVDRFPSKSIKPERPRRQGSAFVAIRGDGAILLRKRPEKGLLGGMSEVPTTAWTARIDGETGAGAAPFAADWQPAGSIRHVFTHFELDLSVYRAEVGQLALPEGWWWSPSVQREALPTVMKKAIEAAVPGITKSAGEQTK
ncbi:MAG: A/G-specific adenine glycosylase [Rhizobiaceae bacterium]|nr:MAG: A/G-specific adenine glycosylase [Rhizobiaceae bacterium]